MPQTVTVITKATLVGTALSLIVLSWSPAGARSQTNEVARGASDAQNRTLQQASELFDGGQYEAVIQKVREFTAQHALTIDNISILFLKAESEYQLDRVDSAIEDYQSALAKIPTLANNVTQRRFAVAHFRLATLLHERKRIDAALAAVEAGLRLVPQYVEGQILLGELLVQQGQKDRALRHYETVQVSSLPVNEERAVLGVKIDRLTRQLGASITPPRLASSQFYSGVSIGLLPLGKTQAEINLADVCVILESSWRMPCHVLQPLTIAEEDIWVKARGQYDADKILDELRRRLPEASRTYPYILAITDRDIFGPQTSFVFSWQGGNEKAGTGVLSTRRFVTAIPDYYERAIIATRRVALQALSSTGRMMGFARPTNPECPLAYPESVREFQVKRLRLCESDEQQRDQLLKKRGGVPGLVGEARQNAIDRVYRAYYID